MAKNFIYLFIAILVFVVVIGFSDCFRKIAEKHDESPLGGTGTDLYFCCSMFALLASVAAIGYNIIVLIDFYN